MINSLIFTYFYGTKIYDLSILKLKKNKMNYIWIKWDIR